MNLFQLGTIEVSPGAEAALAAAGVAASALLERHQSGDWGEIEEHDRIENEFALASSTAVYSIGSSYRLSDGTQIWVLTASDRSCTRVLLPAEEQELEVSAADGYAAWAAAYDTEPNPLIGAEAVLVDPLLEALAFESALDVCSGTGRYALKLARRGAAVTAIDRSSEMLAVLRENARRERLAIDIHQGAIEDGLPFDAERFDLVVCALALCHVQNLAAAIGECGRVLRPGGHFLITDLHPDAVAMGMRTLFVVPGTVYLLKNYLHTRDGYLQAVANAGCELQHVFDIIIRDIPAGYFVDQMSDQNFGLVQLARKQIAQL